MKNPEYGKDKHIQIQNIRDKEYERRAAIRNRNEYKIDIGMSGTTCTLIIIIHNMVYYGFVGDSLACFTKKRSNFAEQNARNHHYIITWPIHIPDNPGEEKRIYKNKGEVRNVPGHQQKIKPKKQVDEDDHLAEQFTQDILNEKTRKRVYVRGRMYPGLGISRSLGDYTAHRIGVISEPSVGHL